MVDPNNQFIFIGYHAHIIKFIVPTNCPLKS